METIVIRQSRITLYGCIIVGAMFILTFFFGPFKDAGHMYKDSPGSIIFFLLIFFGIFLYGLINLITKKSEIILSDEGIEIRNRGFNHWEYVSSISTIVERDNESSDKDYLIIGLKDQTEIRCYITDLDRPPWEILQLARVYKNRYAGGKPESIE